ncbi:hypothetical protein M3P19_15595 [Muricauda sp. 2012CJ35-5]|uniref:Lipoprotein n=1 Tax=Flagellimonas spongiicola TaxID=2942208 RepID=A0ABT0PVL8_9FLAO|nr:hypothetical protein [Allomuricauda spongiicola]MCL6275438.1 hypothetical protein [Allomuricauda spongiicola]
MSVWFILITVVFMSCSSYKDHLKTGNSVVDARYNAILDFSNLNKVTKRHKVFNVNILIKESSNEEPYHQIFISPITNAYPMTQYDTIGSKSDLLYNDYRINKGVLFLWMDPEKRTNRKTLEVMSNFKKLDSSFLKKSDKAYVFSTKEYPKDERTYFFCKSNISKYKVLKGLNKQLMEIENLCD